MTSVADRTENSLVTSLHPFHVESGGKCKGVLHYDNTSCGVWSVLHTPRINQPESLSLSFSSITPLSSFGLEKKRKEIQLSLDFHSAFSTLELEQHQSADHEYFSSAQLVGIRPIANGKDVSVLACSFNGLMMFWPTSLNSSFIAGRITLPKELDSRRRNIEITAISFIEV